MAGVFVVLGFLVVMWLAAMGWVRLQQANSVRVPTGERVQRRVDNTSARVFVAAPLAGGLRAGKINVVKVSMVLSDQRLLLGSWRGRLLVLEPGQGGTAICTGPRRLVLEGALRRRRPVLVRVELILDEAERWAEEISDLLGGRHPAAAAGT